MKHKVFVASHCYFGKEFIEREQVMEYRRNCWTVTRLDCPIYTSICDPYACYSCRWHYMIEHGVDAYYPNTGEGDFREVA